MKVYKIRRDPPKGKNAAAAKDVWFGGGGRWSSRGKVYANVGHVKLALQRRSGEELLRISVVEYDGANIRELTAAEFFAGVSFLLGKPLAGTGVPVTVVCPTKEAADDLLDTLLGLKWAVGDGKTAKVVLTGNLDRKAWVKLYDNDE